LHRFRMSRRRARRVYWPLHDAVVRRRRGDQRCHVVSLTATTILATRPRPNAHRAVLIPIPIQFNPTPTHNPSSIRPLRRPLLG
jgi:hypothetical protein